MTIPWTLLRAGTLRLDGGSMFGVVPRTMWSHLIEPDEHNRIGLQTNCLLLDHPDGRVLIETGCGDKWSDKERGIYAIERRSIRDALAEAQVDPADIKLVIVSHLHFDHAGGLTHLAEDGNPVSTFPNATIVAQRTEWDDAMANKSTMTRTYLRTHLDPIAGQVVTVDGERDIWPGITVWPMPGHTWGQHAIRFDDAEGTVCFAGDVMPTIHHAPPAFSLAYDMLPYQNMLSKQALLTRAHAEGWRLVIDHEPGPPVVRVAPHPKREGRFELDVVPPKS